jgi:quercetin dioxygenase-like cupin family protein
MKSSSVIPILAVVLFSSVEAQESQKAPAGHGPAQAIHSPNQIKWQDGPASLPPGAKFAVLEGDPAQEGFFTMRISMPDGYKIPPHTHPKVEHVTVISGTFNFGMGDQFDRAATQEMPAGTFGFWPAGMKHFVWAKGETVVQLHGIGPWKIEYLNPADDPRKAKKAAPVAK